MATAEFSASTGPRYAPEDPTLPEPWKGLIDGSTGISYYWNPETNVTQYERPAALPPPLTPGPASIAATPKLAPLPMARTLQPNGMIGLQGQQMPQQLVQQPPQQHGQQILQQQQGQQMQQQLPQQQSHQALHSVEQQFSHQQLQQIPYPQGPQILHHHQQIPQQQLQQIPHQQVQQFGFPQKEDFGFQQGKQIAGSFSPQVQQMGFSSIHNLPSGTHQMPSMQMGFHSLPAQQATNTSKDILQTGGSLVQEQQKGIDSIHQKQIGGPMVQSQRGPPMVQNQQAGGPPMGLKMGYEEVQHGRAGNEFSMGGNREQRMVITQQPKLAAIPFARNQQEMRMGVVHPQNATLGHVPGLSIAAGRPMSDSCNYSPGTQAFSNNAPMRPSPRMLNSPDVTNLSPVEVYCQQHEVTASGDNVPAPFMTFGATGFPSEILREIQTAGFSSPTPIQAQTWPIALQSRDILAIAKTGSGKTLGYLLPAFIHLRRCRNNSQVGPTVLVLAPTRELATQIHDEAIKFGRSSSVSCTCLYGGAPKGPQLREIEHGADIVVATPGRLNDILEMKKISFHQVSFLVLDEADRMLDMGFEPQIRKIVNEIPPRRQTLMYSATWPKEVRKIAGDLLINPIQVNIGSVNELAANKAITQYVEVIPQMEKQRRLEQILRSQERGSKVIIFCSTKRLCEQLSRGIGRKFGAAAIHGDKSQDQRDWVLNQFRSGKSPILVATDVAARGLDVKDIRVVINYDFPTGVEDYVHRIGRTGRAGATGVSYTFFTDQDWKHAGDLVKVLEGANQLVPPEVREIAARGGSFKKGQGGISHWDLGGSQRDYGGRGRRGDGGRWDSGGLDGGQVDSRGRGGRYGGRWDSGGRGGRDNGYGGGRGGRRDFFGGRGNWGRGVGGPGGGGRHDQRGRYDIQRAIGERHRGRSYSPSPDKVRTWGYDRSESQSRSCSRSRSRSWTRSRSRSRSRSYDKYERPGGLEHVGNPPPGHGGAPASQMLPISPGPNVGSLAKNETAGQLPIDKNPMPSGAEDDAEPSQHPVADL